MIESLIASGMIGFVAIGAIAVELVLLYAFRSRVGRLSPYVANAASGICLLLALRAALVGQPAAMVGLWLGLGFAAHLGDLFLRLRR